MDLILAVKPKFAVVVSVLILSMASVTASAEDRRYTQATDWISFEVAQRGQDQNFLRQDAEKVLEGAAKEGQAYPYLDVEVFIEIQNDYIYDSDDPGSEINYLFTATEPTFALHLLPGLFIEAVLVLEPVLDPAPFMDHFFEDEGLFVETLSLNYESEVFSLIGGKFTPNFGTAWARTPGVYGADFAEDYEFTERIGFGGSVTLSSKSVGDHTLSASTFFRDNTIFSESAFTNRGRTRISDGGPSNTGDLSSFAVGLDGKGIPKLGGISYHGAVAYQDVSQPGEDAELGFVIGMNWDGNIVAGIKSTTIVEVAYFENADGVGGQDRYFVTAGLGIGYEDWNLVVSHTGRTTTMSGTSDIDDHLLQISVGYQFDFGLTAETGWAWIREDSSNSYLIGVLLSYKFGFCMGCSG